MKIYVVSELNDVYDNENCDVCWKVVKAFMRQEDAKKYVECSRVRVAFHIQDDQESHVLLTISILVFFLLLQAPYLNDRCEVFKLCNVRRPHYNRVYSSTI